MRKPVKLLGGYSQILPSNWKLYMENTKDSYHASPAAHVLHDVPTQPAVAEGRPRRQRGRRQPHQLFDGGRRRRQGIRAGRHCAPPTRIIALEAPELLKSVDEFGDGIGLQILSVFPGFVLQQIRNSLAVRRIVPQGVDRTELVWTMLRFHRR